MYHQSIGRFITRDPLATDFFDTRMIEDRRQSPVSPMSIDRILNSMQAYAATLASRLGVYARMRGSSARHSFIRQELQTASTGMSAILRQLGTEVSKGRLDDSAIQHSLYGYAGNNPIVNVDPTGLAFVNCRKAIQDFMSAMRNAERRYRNNLKPGNWPPDPGHAKAKVQVHVQLSAAYAKVLKHCACDLGKEALEKGKELLEKLKEQLDAFSQAITDREFLVAMGWLLAAVATILLLIALILAAAAAAAPAAA